MKFYIVFSILLISSFCFETKIPIHDERKEGRVWSPSFETDLEIDNMPLYTSKVISEEEVINRHDETERERYEDRKREEEKRKRHQELGQRNNYKLFIEGLAEGFRINMNDEEINVSIFQDCLSNFVYLLGIFKEIEHDFAHFSLTNYKEGVMKLIVACKHIIVGAQECFESIQGFEHIIKRFQEQDTSSMIANLITYAIFHGTDLLDDAKQIFYSFENRDYKNFGYAIGDLIYRILPFNS
jgi:hypothetical protein